MLSEFPARRTGARAGVLHSSIVDGAAVVTRRGRPPNVLRRRLIARTALELFADHGFEGTPMRAVADAAGIGEAVLYRYFPTKRDLLDGVIALAVEAADALYLAFVKTATVQTTLRDFLTAVGTMFLNDADDTGPWYAMRLQALPLDEKQRDAVRESPERSIQLIADGLRLRGTFGDPYVAARSFLGALLYHHMVQVRVCTENSSPELRTIFVRELVDLFAGGREAQPSDDTAGP